MRSTKTDPELPIVLPFQPGPASNGEFVPFDPSPAHLEIAALAMERAELIAHKQCIDRRRFLLGLGGLAVTLGAINAVACGGGKKEPGGIYMTPANGSPEACQMLTGQEFIVDIQTHHVNPGTPPGAALAQVFRAVNANCDAGAPECFGRYYYIKDVFLDSDTTVAVRSDTPSPGDAQDPLTFEEMRNTLETIDMLSSGGASRSLLHSIVVPNVGRLQDQLDQMQARSEQLDVSAWKVYTPYAGTTGKGWFLDDEQYGIPIIDQARKTGVKMICAHKGLPLFGFDPAYASPRDIGVVAKAYPDMKFVVYHSGYDPNSTGPEGPYDPNNAERGVNALVKSLQDNGIAPNSNVWAELGSTWRGVMSDPTQAAHVIGKLLKYVGEDRVCWGTDCIWYGAPQPQIVAFRAFQITPELRSQYGYPELTTEIKAKIFGLTAASLYGIDAEAQRCAIQRDVVDQMRDRLSEMQPDTHHSRWTAHMPIDRRGMLRYFASAGGAWSPWR
jgi:uncharacterized protein